MTEGTEQAVSNRGARESSRAVCVELLDRLDTSADEATGKTCIGDITLFAETIHAESPDIAEDLLRAAHKLSPKPLLISRLVQLMARRGALTEALSTIDTALADRKDETLLLRARLLAAVGQDDEARTIAEDLCASSASLRPAADRLLWQLEYGGSLDQAARLTRVGDFKSAINVYQGILKETPRSPALAHLALAQLKSGHFDAAVRSYRELSRLSRGKLHHLRRLFASLRQARPDVVARWIQRLRWRGISKRIKTVEFARLLAAAHYDAEAFDLLRKVPWADWTDELKHFAYHHYLETCQFLTALSIFRRRGDRRDYRGSLQRLERGVLLSRDWGLSESADFRKAGLERLWQLTTGLREAFAPVDKNLVICLQSTATGPLPRQAQIIARQLAETSGWQVSVLSRGRSPHSAFKPEEPFEVRAIDEFKPGTNWLREHVTDWAELQSVANLLGVDGLVPAIAAFASMRPQVIHNCSQNSTDILLAACLIGAPRILARLAGMHPASRTHPPTPGTELLSAIYRFLTKHDSVVLSAASRDILTSWAQETSIPPTRLTLIYDALGPLLGAEESTPDLRAHLGIPAGAPIVGGVLKLTPTNDGLLWLETARRIADRLPEAHFLVVGEGVLSETMREHVSRLGLDKRFFALPDIGANLTDYYRAMDVFLLTSMEEGLSATVVEAQYAGLPVVAAETSGASDALASADTGRIIGGRDPKPLAEAAIAFIKDEADRSRIAREAPLIIEQRFSLKKSVASYESAYGM